MKGGEASFWRNVLVTGGGVLAGRVLLLMALPAVARLYSPAAVGAWQIFVGLYLVLAPVVTLRYETALILPERDEDAAALLAGGAAVAAGIGALLIVPVLLAADGLAALLGDASLRPYLGLLPPAAFLLGLEQLGNSWLTRRQAFASAAVVQVVRGGMIAGLPIGLALLDGGRAVNLLAGSLGGQALGTALALGLAWRDRGTVGLRPDWGQVAGLLKQYRVYPLCMAPYSFLGQLPPRLIAILLGGLSGPAAAGTFALAQQVTNAPASLVSGALRRVFYPLASRERAPAELGGFVGRTLLSLGRLAVPGLVYFLFFYAGLTRLVLGPGWDEAGRFAAVLAVPAALIFLVSWLDRLFDVHGRQRLVVGLQIAGNLCSLGGFWGTLAAGWSPVASAAVFAGAVLVYELVWLIIVYRLAGFSLVELGGIAARLAGWTAVCAGLSWPCRFVLPEIGGAVAGGIVALLAVGWAGWRAWQDRPGAELPG